MPTDVGNLDHSVSLRDYVDEKQGQRDKATAGHNERHGQEQSAHQHIHELEKQAINTLASLVASQRIEDSRSVQVALEAVQKASSIHAIAHEQQHNAHQAIHDVEKEAIQKATEQMDRRLEGMNEFRDALRDQSGHSMPRELAMAQIEAVRREVAAMMNDLRTSLVTQGSRLDVIQGQSKGTTATIGYFIAAATMVLAIVGLGITLAVK